MFMTIDSVHFRLWLKASISELTLIFRKQKKKQLCYYSGAFNGGQIISIKHIEFAKWDNTLIPFQLTCFPPSSRLNWLTYCWREGLSCELPLLESSFIMPSVWIIKHFSLSWWILSLTFFSSKIFFCLFISLSFPKEYGRVGVGGFRQLGPGGGSRESFGKGNL